VAWRVTHGFLLDALCSMLLAIPCTQLSDLEKNVTVDGSKGRRTRHHGFSRWLTLILLAKIVEAGKPKSNLEFQRVLGLAAFIFGFLAFFCLLDP